MNNDGTFSKCGHMVGAKKFTSYHNLLQSEWLKKIEENMINGRWSDECIRCRESEEATKTSVRLDAVERHKKLFPIDNHYLVVGGVLDNVCNSACQTCNSKLSTKIGSLENKDYYKIDNYEKFFSLPIENILEIDINGGEPTASKNYKKLLKNLPPNVQIVRINTNTSRVFHDIEELLRNKIKVIVTMSFDGTEHTHDYVRRPILWNNYKYNVDEYIELREKYKKNLYLDFWTTVSALNLHDLEKIIMFAENKKIPHSYGLLKEPAPLDIGFRNSITTHSKKILENSNNKICKELSKITACKSQNQDAILNYIETQDKLRNISIKDYLNLPLNFS